MNIAKHLAAALLLLFVVPSCVTNDRQGESARRPAAPNVSLSYVDGHESSLSNLKGSVVVLDFWATWCPPCRRSLPHLNALDQDAKRTERGLNIIAVNFREPAQSAKDYLKQNKLSLPVAIDEEGTLAQDFGVQGLPTTIIIGRDGLIRNEFTTYDGPDSENALDVAIDQALAESPARIK